MGSGLTLVEVLAALAITALVMAGVVGAHQRLVHQWVRADRTLAAVDAADAILARWHARGEPEAAETGTIDGLRWRALQLPNEPAEDLGLRVVRLELFDPRRSADQPLLAIETAWQAPTTEGDGAD